MKLRLMIPKKKAPRPAPAPAKNSRPARALRATASRYADEEEYDEDYEENEPSMKFGQAFMVVLALHLIAVCGVLAFNALKNKKENAGPAIVAETVAAPAQSGAAPSETPALQTAANTPAPAAPAVPATAPALRPAVAGQTYEVVAGDTLNKIATRYGISIEAIEQANGMSREDTIRVGQKLIIPGHEAGPAVARNIPAPAPVQPVQPKKVQPPAVPAQSAPPTTASGNDLPADGTYIVAKGDNPYSIAKKFKVSYTELLKINNIEDPTKLQIGQKLKLPAPKSSN